MTAVFVDTSAMYALLVADDAFHPRAREAFARLRARDAKLTTTSYVLVECYALLQRRVGMEALVALREQLVPLIDVEWVRRDLHELGLDDLARTEATAVSLVDAVSFAAMRAGGADAAFTFDVRFADEGFEVVG